MSNENGMVHSGSRAMAAPLEFTDDQRQMIRDTFANGASDAEFAVLMEIAKARRLNPLLRQIHFVKRWNTELRREVWNAQAAIDGLRAVAQRTGLYAGQDEPEFVENPDGTLKLCRVRVSRIELPGEGVAVWRSERPVLAKIDAAHRETAWKLLCAHVEKVGNMKNAKVWLKKAIAEADARDVEGPLPDHDPPTGTDGPARPAANDTSATSTPVAHGAAPATTSQALDVVDAPGARSADGADLSTRALRRAHLVTKDHPRAVEASYAAHPDLPGYLDDCTARMTAIVAHDGTQLSALTARKRLVDARNRAMAKRAQSAMERAA